MRSQRALMTATASGLVVILVAWFMLVYSPKGAEISEVREKTEAAEGEEQSLRATLAQLESIDEARPEEEAEVRRLTAAVPPQPELASFILTVHDAASRADLAFLAISPAFPTQQAGVAASTIGATIDLEGDFFNVLDFLGRLEDLERVAVVDSMALTAGASGGEDATGTAPAAALGAQPVSSSPPDPSAPVEMTMGTGTESISVTTDAATAGRTATVAAPATTTTTTLARQAAGIFLLPHQAVTRLPNRLLRVSLQVRIFTTAPPVSGEGDEETTTTTTTAPGGAPTTTVPAGGGG